MALPSQQVQAWPTLNNSPSRASVVIVFCERGTCNCDENPEEAHARTQNTEHLAWNSINGVVTAVRGTPGKPGSPHLSCDPPTPGVPIRRDRMRMHPGGIPKCAAGWAQTKGRQGLQFGSCKLTLGRCGQLSGSSRDQLCEQGFFLKCVRRRPGALWPQCSSSVTQGQVCAHGPLYKVLRAPGHVECWGPSVGSEKGRLQQPCLRRACITRES